MPPQDPSASGAARAPAASPEAWIGAAALMLVGVFLLDLMGVLIKALSARYSPGELAAWRNLLGMGEKIFSVGCPKA